MVTCTQPTDAPAAVGVTEPAVFGSVARDKNTPTAIDLLADLTSDIGLRLGRLRERLEESSVPRSTLVSGDDLKPDVRERIEPR